MALLPTQLTTRIWLRGAGADSAPSKSRYYLDCTYLASAETISGNQKCRSEGLLRCNADSGHHAASLAELGTMGEEARCVASSAALDDADVLLADAGVFELAVVGGNQIEVDFRAEIAVAGSPLVEEEQRVADVGGVGVEDLFEELVGVVKLRFELRANFVADGIAATAHA